MPAVYACQDSATIGMLKAMLLDEGIACEMRNEASHALLGHAAFGGLVMPEIWVIDEHEHERAKKLIMDFLNAPAADPTAEWICDTCREKIEGVFAKCWNCGGDAPPTHHE